jgi:hypothetical protein
MDTAYTGGTLSGLIELDGEIGCETILSCFDLFASPGQFDGVIAHKSFRMAVAADGSGDLSA